MKGKQGWKNESQRHRLAGMGIKTSKKGTKASGRKVVQEFEVFRYDELPPEIQEKVIENLRDINIDHEWWEIDGLLDLTSDEMDIIKVKLSKKWWESSKEKDSRGNIIGEYPAHTGLIKYKIDEFDLDRGGFIKFENIEIVDDEVFRKYLEIPKKTWDKLDYFFSNYGRETNTEIGFEAQRDLTPREEDIVQKASDIWDNKVSESITSLRSQYEYLSGEEAIIETIKANEYEFTKDGDLH